MSRTTLRGLQLFLSVFLSNWSQVGGLKFSMAPVPLTQCATNCGVHAFGNGTNGVAVYRMIRWTPKKGQEGKDYSLCFRAVDTRNTSGVPLVKCFYIRVKPALLCSYSPDSSTGGQVQVLRIAGRQLHIARQALLHRLVSDMVVQSESRGKPRCHRSRQALKGFVRRLKLVAGSLVNLGGLYAPPAPIQISQVSQ
eukprot:767876-Hanusia_phi.AAC.2